MFVVPENLITARGGGHTVYCCTAVQLVVANSSCSYKFITEEQIDLHLNQEEEREVVGQFYIPISSTAPLLHYTGQEEGRPSD